MKWITPLQGLKFYAFLRRALPYATAFALSGRGLGRNTFATLIPNPLRLCVSARENPHSNEYMRPKEKILSIRLILLILSKMKQCLLRLCVSARENPCSNEYMRPKEKILSIRLILLILSKMKQCLLRLCVSAREKSEAHFIFNILELPNVRTSP